MKEKIITLKIDGAATGQWSSLLLELNLMKQAWKSYGVDVTLKAHSINKIITQGTSIGEKQIKKKKNHITKIFR